MIEEDENFIRNARFFFFQSNLMKLFDETIVALSFKWKRGSNRRCVKPVPEIRCTCVCTRKDGGGRGRGGVNNLPSRYSSFFIPQRRDPRKYITLDVVSTPLSDVADLFLLAWMYSVFCSPARFLARRGSKETFPHSPVRGDTLHRGGAKVIYLAELARAFLHRSVRRKLDTREDIRATHTMTGRGASHSTIERSRYRCLL